MSGDQILAHIVSSIKNADTDDHDELLEIVHCEIDRLFEEKRISLVHVYAYRMMFKYQNPSFWR